MTSIDAFEYKISTRYSCNSRKCTKKPLAQHIYGIERMRMGDTRDVFFFSKNKLMALFYGG